MCRGWLCQHWQRASRAGTFTNVAILNGSKIFLRNIITNLPHNTQPWREHLRPCGHRDHLLADTQLYISGFSVFLIIWDLGYPQHCLSICYRLAFSSAEFRTWRCLGDKFPRNVGSHTDYTVLCPRRWQHYLLLVSFLLFPFHYIACFSFVSFSAFFSSFSFFSLLSSFHNTSISFPYFFSFFLFLILCF